MPHVSDCDNRENRMADDLNLNDLDENVIKKINNVIKENSDETKEESTMPDTDIPAIEFDKEKVVEKATDICEKHPLAVAGVIFCGLTFIVMKLLEHTTANAVYKGNMKTISKMYKFTK